MCAFQRKVVGLYSINYALASTPKQYRLHDNVLLRIIQSYVIIINNN
jgi:hypothetical protein